MAVSAADLTKLYLAYFGRPPDFDGLQFYTSPANANLTIAQVAAGFSASAESQALYGSTSLSGMINNIYMNIFGRPADVSGLQFWSDAINTGKVTPALAAYNILTGALLLNNADGAVVLNKLAVATAWDQALNTPAEIVGYTGATAASTARAFLASVDGTPASLAAHSGAALDAAINAAINAQGQITASVSSPTITEGNSGTKVMTFTIQLDKAPTVPLTLNYTTSGGTATANDDYTTAAGAVTFAAGQTIATVDVTVIGDNNFEGNETVNLVVTGPLANAGGTATATGTITDDDPTPAQLTYVASVSAPVVDEGNTGTTTLAFVIHLDHAAVGPVTVNYQTLITGTGTPGTDFISQAGTIVFANGQQDAVVNVVVNGDVTVEDTETVVLQVTGTQLSNSGVTATGTITNDDAQPLLTQQIDNIVVQGTGPNTIKGIVDGTTPGNSTFSIGDNIVGNGATVVELYVAATGTGAFANVDNVAAINVIAGVGGPITFNAIQWDNVGAVNLAAGVNGATVNISNLETGVDLGIGASVGGQIAVTYTDNDFVNLFNFGKGGASFDADGGNVMITMGNAVPQFTAQSAGVVIASSNDVTLGDITINGGADNAAAVLSVSASGDIMINGDISMSVGDATTTSALDSIVLAAGGNVTIDGGIAEIAGDSASALLAISAGSDINSFGIGQAVGASGFASISLFASDDINVSGLMSQVGQTGAVENINVYASDDVLIHGIAQNGGSSATAIVAAGGDISITAVGGNGPAVSQSAGAFVSLSVSATGSGDVHIGDVMQGASTSNAQLFVGAHGGDIDLGVLSQNFNTSGHITVSNTSGGDIMIGGVSQIGATSGGSAVLSVTATSSGDITIGDIFQSMQTSGYMSVTINADSGDIDVGNITQTGLTSASAFIGIYGSADVSVGDVNVAIGSGTSESARFSVSGSGDVSVGDVSVSIAGGNGQYASVSIENHTGHDLSVGNVFMQLGDNSGTANTGFIGIYNENATGDLTVGNVTLDLGITSTGNNVTISQTGTASADVGDLTVGDINVTLADKASVTTFLIKNSQSAASTTTMDVGDLTVGDINFVMGTNANANLTISELLYGTSGGDIGDVTVGDLTIGADVNASVSINLLVSNTASGDIGDVSVGDVNVMMDDGGSFSYEIDVLATNGDIGSVSVGDVSVVLGVSGQMNSLDIEVTAANVGDVSIGDVNVEVGQFGHANSVTIDISATTGDLGDVSIGTVGAVIGQSGDGDNLNVTVQAFGGDIGNVNFGGFDVELGASASFTSATFLLSATAGSIGDVTVGDIFLSVGTSATMGSVNFTIDAFGDIGDVTFGNITETLATSGFAGTIDIDITASNSGNIGNVTFGNMSLVVGSNADLNDEFVEISVSATNGDIGDVKIGNISMHGMTGAGQFDGVYITIDGNNIGNFALGDVNVTLDKSASMSDMLFVSVTATGDIGDVTIGDFHMVLGTNAAQTSYDTVSITAGANIGDVSFGDIVAELGKTASANAINRSISAGTDIGNVSFGDLEMSAITSASFTGSLNIDITAGGSIGNITFGDVSLNGVAMGNSMTLEIFASAAAGDIGDVTLGDWTLENRGANTAATVTNTYDMYASASFDANGGDVGNFTVGNVSVLASGTSNSATAEFIVHGQNIGNVSLGDLEVNSAAGGYAEIIVTASATTGDLGDVMIGDVTLGQTGTSYDSITVNLVAAGDIGNITMGDVNVNIGTGTGSSGYYAQFELQVTAGGAVGDVTIGDINVNVMHATSGAQVTFDMSATDIGNVDIGDISLVGASNTGGYATVSLDFATMTSLDTATLGTITFNGTTSSTMTLNGYFGTADVTIEGITVMGSGQFGTDAFLSITGGDIHIGTVAVSVSATSAAFNITDILGSVVATGAIDIDTVDYSNYVLSGASNSITIDVSAWDVANVIGSANNDTIIVGAAPVTMSGGAGTDHFDMTAAVDQDATSLTPVANIKMYTVTDFKAGAAFGETLNLDSFNTTVAYYSEKTATSFANAVTTALATMSDPTLQSDVVAVQVGGDVYVFVDSDNENNIDQVIKLVGVSNAQLNFADFILT